MSDEAKLALASDAGWLLAEEIDQIVRESPGSPYGHLRLIADAAYEKARGHFGLRLAHDDSGYYWLTAREVAELAKEYVEATEGWHDDAHPDCHRATCAYRDVLDALRPVLAPG